MKNVNSILDVSVNSILDVTPRKACKGIWSLVSGAYGAATNRKVKELTKEVEQLKRTINQTPVNFKDE